MTLIVIVPFLVCLVGLVLFAATSGKMSDAGRIMFAAGLVVTLLVFSARVVRL